MFIFCLIILVFLFISVNRYKKLYSQYMWLRKRNDDLEREKNNNDNNV